MGDAARQLGLSTTRYAILETGRDLPRPNEMRRLNEWMFEGKVFDTKIEPWATYKSNQGIKNFRVRMFENEAKEVIKAAAALGMSCDDFLAFCARRYLDSEPVITHHRQAADEYATSRALLIQGG